MINSIDQQKCIGCGTCSKSCGLDVFRLNTDQPELSPCMAACPAGTDIRGYQALLQLGDVYKALDLLKQTNPFPAITGRVCFYPCESQCARKNVDQPVSINAMEQFLGDTDLEDQTAPPPHLHMAKVAVVGAGPAGLSAAWFLTNLGYQVSVYEAMPEAGGMLRYAIPDYRLPTTIVHSQVAKLTRMGVRFYFNTSIGNGKDITLTEMRQRGCRAVIVCTGTSQSKKLPLEGASVPGVHWGLDFLRSVRCAEAPALSGTVIVVGGGDVAVDAAISAKHLGASNVIMVSLETEDALPAYPHNIEDARREGIEFRCGFGPVRVEEKNEVVNGLLVHPCLRVFDDKGAFAPSFDTAKQIRIDASAVIFAIGQTPEKGLFDTELQTNDAGYIVSDAITCATSHLAVFTAGDVATGPASVIQAVAGGREAAFSADRYLRGVILLGTRGAKRSIVPEDRLPGKDLPCLPRHDRKITGGAKPDTELRQGLRADEVFAESLRCMTCGSKARIAYNDDCMTCYTCELVCPSGAINVHPYKEILPRTL